MVAPDLLKIEQSMVADLDALRPEIAPLLHEVLRYGLMNGGKRIRPLLVVLCYRLCGGMPAAMDIHHLALAFEYLHCATLFHDDVIDQAQSRRGSPAVNVAFGETAAILSGDFLHARSMLMVARGGGVAALEVFCEATTAMVDGEFLQLRNVSQLNQAEEDYFAVIMGKTARLIGAACEIGALVAGAGAEERRAMREYGLHLGCAFQIVDDLLDYLGDEASTGKAVGNDFQEGKMTLPLILALTAATGQDRERLLLLLADAGQRKQRFAEARAIMTRYEAFARARQRAEEIAALALKALGTVSGDGEQMERSVLEALVGYVLTRNK